MKELENVTAVEKSEAWAALFEWFGQVPVPETEVWQVMVALKRAMDERAHMLTVVSIYRERHEAMLSALKGIKRLFDDPSPFYIKKLGAGITNGDQDRIDATFRAVDSAIAQARGEDPK